MTSQLTVTLVILVLAVVVLLSERLRADLVALGLTGVLTPSEAFSGFASPAVVTIVAIFVLTEALRLTGVTERAGALLEHVGGGSERRLVLVLMLAGAVLSLLMNNIAAAAILLPAASGLTRAGRNHVSPSRLLIPLAFATILGGMATLFTTTNLVVSDILRYQNISGFGVLDLAAVGVPLAVAGIAYMVIWGRRLLPSPTLIPDKEPARRARPDLVEVYRLGERLFRARVPADSCFSGLTLAQSGLRETYGVNVVALERQGDVIPAPFADTILAAGDIVFLQGGQEEFQYRDAAA